MKINLTNKVILLTGASTGIGRELVKKLANENANLAILSRRKELLDDLINQINPSSKIISYKCDVRDFNEVQSVYNQVKSDLGEIDIAILNSGVSYRMSESNFEIDKAREIFETNFFGVVNFVHLLKEDFIKRKAGMIVGVSSLADTRGFPGSGFYCASKSALTIFLESLRVELKKHNISVITVRPGFVRTPMTDKNEFYMPLLMEPEKAAEIILDGIKKNKRVIEFPFLLSLMVKILKILPNGIFEYFASQKPKPR
ncbi:MAG: SDR family NAD(P)-dependent oxidoreductase [Ignavibacterium sp.]|nr:SDR family NAD(P)-dependent oxidoreductase [Ignavibacterium sp.]MDW8375473.1 SDR family NAD(P)-dependent oxidoreductase [Ignavibacteriales bacterium]